MRDYGIEPIIWDAKDGCEHKWVEYIKKGITGGKDSPKLKIKGSENYQETPDSQSQFCSSCNAWRGSLGLEPTPELYIAHLMLIMAELKRVLKKTGTCWINLGDSYAQGGTGGSSMKSSLGYGGRVDHPNRAKLKQSLMNKESSTRKAPGIPAKSLCAIPERFVLAMLEAGWIRRSTIIWHKPNCMPQSADDKFTVDFEYVYFFVKNNKTLFWINEHTKQCVDKRPAGIKGIEGTDWEWIDCPTCMGTGHKVQAYSGGSVSIEKEICKRCKGTGKVKHNFWSGHDYYFEQQFEPQITKSFEPRKSQHRAWDNDPTLERGKGENSIMKFNPLGRNKRCVLRVPSHAFSDAHFATFPPALIDPMVKAGCPAQVCPKCGKGKERIVEWTGERVDQCGYKEGHEGKTGVHQGVSKTGALRTGLVKVKSETGLTDCGCRAPFRPGIVLDPFMGAGTSALVAYRNRRDWIGCELNPEYIRMAEKRLQAERDKTPLLEAK